MTHDDSYAFVKTTVELVSTSILAKFKTFLASEMMNSLDLAQREFGCDEMVFCIKIIANIDSNVWKFLQQAVYFASLYSL